MEYGSFYVTKKDTWAHVGSCTISASSPSSPTRREDMGKMLSGPVVPEVWFWDQRDSTPWEIC